MAVNPSFIKPLKAEIINVKGTCSANHRTGDTFSISCYDSGGLCGFFYHDLFPGLSVMQFGGKYPWSSPDELIVECPDRGNAVTIKLTAK
ncbi:MAG: hypothetical protein A2Y65_11855 [Deltaproteobacteria bacterium RBG_13_52_11]|nr:MAG: hypothetical protein A2Y65_11855 [Deltaproteobacteria bacterium RBG_13_52_11]